MQKNLLEKLKKAGQRLRIKIACFCQSLITDPAFAGSVMCDWQKHASFLSHFLSITWSTWFLKTNNRPSQKNEGRNLIFLCGAPS